MALSITPPEGYLSTRGYSEKYLVSETTVRSWIMCTLVKVQYKCGRAFVLDTPPTIKHFDEYRPSPHHLCLGVWAAREKVSIHAVKQKVANGEIEVTTVWTPRGTRKYICKNLKWRWRKNPERYAPKKTG